jgi:hypothetical protein
MDRVSRHFLGTFLVASATLVGCASPYHTDRDALVGGLGGAGVGALVGHAMGNTGAGAVIGAAAGTLGGAAVGAEKDAMEARHQAELAAVSARQAPSGAVTMEEVVNLVHAGVNEDLVVNQVRTRGLVRPVQSSDLISLQSQGVSSRVIQAMQEAPTARPSSTAVIVQQPGPPAVIVDPYPYYYEPWYGPGPYYHPYHHHPGPGVGWGVSFHN